MSILLVLSVFWRILKNCWPLLAFDCFLWPLNVSRLERKCDINVTFVTFMLVFISECFLQVKHLSKRKCDIKLTKPIVLSVLCHILKMGYVSFKIHLCFVSVLCYIYELFCHFYVRFLIFGSLLSVYYLITIFCHIYVRFMWIYVTFMSHFWNSGTYIQSEYPNLLHMRYCFN